MKNNQSKTPVRVRIAPSPTGNLHIGTVRTSLFNYLFARKYQGTFIVRSEDTDKERSKPEYEKNILDGLEWLGLKWDEFYRQSDRTDVYTSYLQKMIDSGHAYISKEEPVEKTIEEKEKRDSVIRFKNPNTVITFDDMIRGEISFDTTDLGDFVVAKSLTEPLYHLAVVVDDHEMNISHIIRGDDGIANTPRQILIQQAIGATQPQYAHIPLILSKEKKKLSKRDGISSILEYKDKGYLKEALVNFLALLGWHPEDEKEIFSMEELIEAFDIERVQKGGAVFEPDKLDWFNREYIKQIPDDEFSTIVSTYSGYTITNAKFLEIIRERIVVFCDIATVLDEGGEFNHLITNIETPPVEKVIWKDATPEMTKEYIAHAISVLEQIPEEDFIMDTLKKSLWDYATEKGRGAVLWPIRYSLSGLDRSPDPFTIMDILGKEKTIVRLRNVVEKL